MLPLKRDKHDITVNPARPDDEPFFDWRLSFWSNENHATTLDLTDEDVRKLRRILRGLPRG